MERILLLLQFLHCFPLWKRSWALSFGVLLLFNCYAAEMPAGWQQRFDKKKHEHRFQLTNSVGMYLLAQLDPAMALIESRLKRPVEISERKLFVVAISDHKCTVFEQTLSRKCISGRHQVGCEKVNIHTFVLIAPRF